MRWLFFWLVPALIVFPSSQSTEPSESASSPEAAMESTEESVEKLSPRYQRWFGEVEVLLSDAEREVFLDLRQDYQRDQFIRRFWKVRDPFPQTGRNEFQEVWEARSEIARDLFEDLDSERARMLLYFGEPSRRTTILCSEVRSLDIWHYEDGSDRISGYFTLVFTRQGELWRPSQGVQRLIVSPRSPSGSDGVKARWIAAQCTRGDEILAALAQSLDVDQAIDNALLIPQPNDEWVRTFASRSTDLPEDALPLEASHEITFPGRHQSRTVVQSLVAVPRAAAQAAELGEARVYNLLIDGEILRRDELFDQFRYRFDFREQNAGEVLPLVTQRYLRPGAYRLILKVEDLTSGRVYREERDIEVPRVARTENRPEILSVSDVLPDANVAERPDGPDLPTPAVFETRLLEANAAISTGDHIVRIVPPPDELLIGPLRVLAQVQGEGVHRVGFELDGRPVMKKSRPPYSVELDLGDKPRIHQLRAIAYDDAGRSLAVDEVLINGGPHRFAVRFLEPQPGKRYVDSVRVHAEVEIPEDEKLDRVELFLNETRLATLYQPPFEQPLLLDRSAPVAYVRAVAYLKDGSQTEEAVFINAPDYVDDVQIDFIELFASVVDKKGNPLTVEREELTVLEDGEVQEIRRFEPVEELPIRAGLVLDTSTSMMPVLRDVEKAALHFFDAVLTPGDRAALMTFNDEPRLGVRFTGDREVLAGGLVNLVAEGETALWDSVLFALHYFSGLSGQRAIVVLTDGEDSASRHAFEDVLDFARHTGAAIYFVALNLQADVQTTSKLRQLAEETGGECHFISHVNQLTKIYDEIETELRSQYLIAYQSSQERGDKSFREVEVRVERKGVEVKTIRGYFP